jgi:hypothetical protein
MDIEQNSQAADTTTRRVIHDVNEAFNRQDPEALLAKYREALPM